MGCLRRCTLGHFVSLGVILNWRQMYLLILFLFSSCLFAEDQDLPTNELLSPPQDIHISFPYATILDGPWEALHWQSNSNPTFDQEFIHSENIETTEEFSLVNPGYIRMRGLQYGQWSPWSLPMQVTARALRPSYVEADVWETASHYFLPDNHPIKPVLDEIFSASRVTLTQKNFKKSRLQKHKTGKI